jgi:hypothetical protein
MSDIDEAKIKEYITFQFRRSITNFYKHQLNVIEDLRQDHDAFIRKLSTLTSKEHIKNMDYFDDNKYNYIRKKVLDNGNEVYREFEKVFEQLNVSLKK